MNNSRIIYKVVRAYYEDRLTQQEIGNKYGISRIKVWRLLSKALNDKIVEIKINTPAETNHSLEQQLENKYGLKEVVVVKTESDSQNDVVASIGQAGASYLLKILEGDESLGISWGRTILALVNALHNSNLPNLKIIQMIGGLGYPEEELSGTELTRRMANALNATPKILNSPGIVATSTTCKALKSDPQVSSILKMAKKSSISLVGIGHFSTELGSKKLNSILSEKDIETLGEKGAVGDISLRFFDKEGQFIKDGINKRVVGLTIDELRNIPRRIAIAGGKHKLTTIKAALKGELINILITDKNTAIELMK